MPEATLALDALPELPRRRLGRTGVAVSIVGAGDAADRKLGTNACIAVLERARALGVNLFDTAPSYENGMSQQIVGHLIRPRPRSNYFVVDKVDKLRSDVIPQLDRNIYTLRLERMDLCVFHAVNELADWDFLNTRGQGFDMMDIGRREKLLNWIGISSHNPLIVEKAIRGGRCDVVMFPLGPFVHPRYRELVAIAREHDVGTICFKSFGAGKLLGPTTGYGRPLAPEAPEGARALTTRLTAEECVRYTLTLGPDVVLLGMSTISEVETALGSARAFTPLDPEELASVEARAALEVVGKGEVWWDPGKPRY